MYKVYFEKEMANVRGKENILMGRNMASVIGPSTLFVHASANSLVTFTEPGATSITSTVIYG